MVRFLKLDGDERLMTCTLMEEFKPVPKKDDPLTQKKVRELSDKTVVVWDVNAQAFRSFRYDRVQEVYLDADEITKAKIHLDIQR